jgi:hypothetical protein
MSQRNSDYSRRADEDYRTPAWVGQTIARYLRRANVTDVWEPAAGAGALAATLTDEGFSVVATTDDFLKRTSLPREGLDAIVSNPPYGADRRAGLACEFIRHALTLPVHFVVMLLRVDFDSGKTRVDLFRDNPRFAGKITLIDRIVWFDRKGAAPSDNHAWFVWADHQRGSPTIHYAGKAP